MKFNYHYVLHKKFSHREYSCSGEFSTILWHDDLPPVTQEEFDQADLELQKVEYLELRKAEYPNDREKTAAMWEVICNKDESLLNDLKKKIADVDNKYQPPKEDK